MGRGNGEGKAIQTLIDKVSQIAVKEGAEMANCLCAQTLWRTDEDVIAVTTEAVGACHGEIALGRQVERPGCDILPGPGEIFTAGG